MYITSFMHQVIMHSVTTTFTLNPNGASNKKIYVYVSSSQILVSKNHETSQDPWPDQTTPQVWCGRFAGQGPQFRWSWLRFWAGGLVVDPMFNFGVITESWSRWSKTQRLYILKFWGLRIVGFFLPQWWKLIWSMFIEVEKLAKKRVSDYKCHGAEWDPQRTEYK